MTQFRALAVFLAMTLPTAVGAETAYVIDRLAVGVHKTNALDSPIIEVLPTATPLEVLSRTGEFAQVQTANGNSGWVDASYLMLEKPAQLAVLELEARHKEVTSQLALVRAEADELKTKLVDAEARGTDVRSTGAPEARRTAERLAAENERLKEELIKARAAVQAPVTPAGSVGAAKSPRTSALIEAMRTKWNWILLGFLLLLAFGLGGYWVDYQSRRRHGGFRI